MCQDPLHSERKVRNSHSKYFLFTCDVEYIGPETSRGIRAMAGLLEDFGVRGTFFCTGRIMLDFREEVDRLQAAGHEIASHGFSHPEPDKAEGEHVFLDRLSDSQLASEIERSYTCFAEAGIRVEGFRAPAFKADHRSSKFVSRFFTYESSRVRPFDWSLSGKKHCFKSYEKNQQIFISRLKCVNLPFGSSYFMLMGPLAIPLIKKYLSETSLSVFYCHSYDLTPLDASIRNSCGIGRLKWSVYYRHCGARGFRNIFSSIIGEALRQGFNFHTCGEFMRKESHVF